MKVAPAQFDQALSALNRIVAIASFLMIAPIVIIANSIALAMLERRRELGILKSAGYTSRTILSQVLIENGITGGVGAFVATLLTAGGVTLSSKMFFGNNLTLNIEPIVVVSIDHRARIACDNSRPFWLRTLFVYARWRY